MFHGISVIKTNLLWNSDIDIRFDGTLRYGWKALFRKPINTFKDIKS